MEPFALIGLCGALATAVPLAWKWQLGIVPSSTAVAIIALVSGTLLSMLSNRLSMSTVAGAAAVWAITLVTAALILAYRFYRDPERDCPDRPDAIISPADGEVIYVRSSAAGTAPIGSKQGNAHTLVELTKTPLHAHEGVVIGISMNFLDVHVNRAPISGRVAFQRHFPGQFGSLRLPEMVFRNERVTTLIENNGVQVAVVQIASRLVRQIVSFVQAGDVVERGQRIGAIRFGSQVDLVLPAHESLRIMVAAGARVRAGESVIALLGDPDRRSNPPFRQDPKSPIRAGIA